MTVQSLIALGALAGGLLCAAGQAQAGPMQDIGANAGPQCAGIDVNDSGYVVGACVESNGSNAGFVASAPGSAVELAHLANGRSCSAFGITNVGRVVGSCLNADSMQTAAVWNAGAPTSVQALQPLLGGVRTKATALNHGGVIAGISISANRVAVPAMWRNGETNARALPAGLLGLDATNCAPSDVDNVAANPGMPNIVGNCPGANGRPQPILWTTGILGAYAATALAQPSSALYCAAFRIANTRILGHCDFGAQGHRAVLWTNPASAPLELVTTPARNTASGLNAQGAVIGSYTNSGGDSVPFHWNTASNTRVDIPPLAGGSHVRVVAIGDNGAVAGSSETSDGTSHAFSWSENGGSVDLGTLPGGKNSVATALSQNGCYLTGRSEASAGQDMHAFVKNLCTP